MTTEQTDDSNMQILFYEAIGNDDLAKFEELLQKPPFFKLFQTKVIEIVKQCVIDDAINICEFLISENHAIYQIYNAEQIANLIEDVGSLAALSSVFTEDEVSKIFERYQLGQFTKDGKIFWLDGDELRSAKVKRMKEDADDDTIYVGEHIINTEAKLQKAEGWLAAKFEIRKKICDVNNLAKLAAQHDSPKVLEMLMSHEDYDCEIMSASSLAYWAAWDDAPNSLALLLQVLGASVNGPFTVTKEDDTEAKYDHFISFLQEVAKHEHAKSALEVLEKVAYDNPDDSGCETSQPNSPKLKRENLGDSEWDMYDDAVF